MNGYFNSWTYNTPVKDRPSIWARLKNNSRLYFTLKYGYIVLKTRAQARRKEYDRKAWADSSIYIFRLIEKTGGVFHITGMENITKVDGPVLFISNHMSTLETMVFPGLIAPLREVTFVVKESLVRHPLFGDVMSSRNPIVVGRKDPRKDLEAVISGGLERLSRGISLIIFPQSTRSLEFKPEEFNSLGVKIAKKAGVPVIPIAIKTDFWGQGKLIKELGPLDSRKHIFIKFGEPLNVNGTGKEENQLIISFIKDSLQEWKEKV